MRTIEEVRARFNNQARCNEDVFGFGSEVLGVFLPEVLGEGAAPDPFTEEHVLKEARSYLAFAFDKAINHRGLSAGRSVIKMREYAWILGMDDAVAFADDDANYAQYGVPVLKRMAASLNVEIPREIAEWVDGGPCRPGCGEGCGR
jgi:hypothetical protein